MSSGALLDSVAVFRDRCRGVGLPASAVSLLEAAGIDSLAKFAFATAAQPGSGDETAFSTFLSTTLGEPNLAPGLLACARRLWYESHAVALSDIKLRTEATDETAPRKLPVPERASRLKAQQLRITGIKIEDVLEPSHQLVDFIFGMKDSETLKYIDPALCTSRTQELAGVKKEPGAKIGSRGEILVSEAEQGLRADITNEYRLRLALQRRSLALDQADLLEYDVSEAYHSFLFSLLSAEVPQHCKQVDTIQLLTADRILYQRMAPHTREGISTRADGTRPMSEALAKARVDPIFMAAIAPVPKPAQRNGKGGKWNSDNQDQPQREHPYNNKGATKGKKGGKGAGKGKAPKRSSYQFAIPKGLLGYQATRQDGSRRCFDFNLGGCKLKCTNGACTKGYHDCVKCGSSDHGLPQCPVK